MCCVLSAGFMLYDRVPLHANSQFAGVSIICTAVNPPGGLCELHSMTVGLAWIKGSLIASAETITATQPGLLAAHKSPKLSQFVKRGQTCGHCEAGQLGSHRFKTL